MASEGPKATSGRRPSVSVIVPVYNSAESLGELTARLTNVLVSNTEQFELLLVNDGSRDESWDVITRLAASNAAVRGVNLVRNHGQHNALLCGIRLARHDALVTMDDDLQNRPEDVPQLLNSLHAGFDVVYGTPQRSQAGLWRNLASRVTKLVLRRAMGAETADRVSTFRAFRSEVREGFAGYQAPFVNIDVLLTWGASRFGSIAVPHEARRFGRSTYTFGRLVRHTLNMVTGFSTFPLQLASLIGLVMALFGVAVLIYVVGRYVIQGSIPGFPFLASIIAIFSGTQLFALGIMGEYLARIFLRMMGRPSYTVRQTTF